MKRESTTSRCMDILRRHSLPLLVAALICHTATAHDQIPGAPQTQPIAIVGGLIHTVDGADIDRGSVLFDAGKIVSVGLKVVIPKNAKTIDATGKHVYPGLFESMSDIGLREINAVDATVDHTEYGDRNPNARSWVAVNPDSELIPVARSNGVLTALTAPRGNWLRGQSAVIHLDGWTAAEMTLRAPAGLYVNWRTMQPSGDDANQRATKREEKLLELDALLDEARRYGDAREARPESTPTDMRLESLLLVTQGRLPIIAEANRQSVIESAVTYAENQKLAVIIYGGYDAADCADLLAKYNVPVIIAGIYRLPLRRHDVYDAAFTLPERLKRAGVQYAIAGSGAGSPGGAAHAGNLPYHAAAAVAFGLPRQDAVRAITLSPAEILGVEKRIGSITVGKDATLLITDGDILETQSHVTTAFIQGREVDLGSRHKTLYEKYKRKYTR